MNTNYSKIRSSWNPDRIGNCLAAKHSCGRKPRARYFFAQRSGHKVSVRGARGKELYAVWFEKEVVQALVKDGFLEVTTVDACVRKYNVLTGELVSETWPTPPMGGLSRAAFALAA